MTENSRTAQFASAYVRKYNLAIVPIEPGMKGPRGVGWNQPGGYLTQDAEVTQFYNEHPDWNMGVVLGPSGLCSLDIDHVEHSTIVLDALGIDLHELRESCPTIVGNPARFRLLFLEPIGVELGRKALTWPNKDDPDGSIRAGIMRQAVAADRAGEADKAKALREQANQYNRKVVLEFRAGAVQDVFPPSIHPETKKPYEWARRPNGSFPLLDNRILELWEDWESFQQKANEACPWYRKPAKPARSSAVVTRDGMSVVDAYNQAHDIAAALERYGYAHSYGGRYLSPHSSTGQPGVFIQEGKNKAWNEHASDPLCSSVSRHPVGPFDLFCEYEHAGDFRSAVVAAAKVLGIDTTPQQRPAVREDQPGEVTRETDNFAPMYSDSDIALRYVERSNGDAVWCETWGRWLLWEGTRWRKDETLAVLDQVRSICAVSAHELLSNPNSKTQASQAARLTSYRTITAVERLARTDRRVSTHPDEWDADQWALNTPGGIVDLRSGQIRAHTRADKITKSTSVAPAGDCPTWRQFLQTATAGDTELQAFLQRMCGYMLTGSVREHALFFVYGTGGNGKGTFLNTVTSILADYQVVSSAETFTESKSDRHETEVARLVGARLVSAQETEEGKRWAESRIKALTGGDPISARFMRQDYFTFLPQFKLLIVGNHKPAFRSVDEAIRRRLHLIPFTVSIPAGERDPYLPEKLKSEAAGILQWMIDGCLEWQRIGLSPPAIVKDSTDIYLEDEDSIQQWIDEECVLDAPVFTAFKDLFESWTRWAERNGEFVGSQKRLAGKLEGRGFRRDRRGGVRGVLGIRCTFFCPENVSNPSNRSDVPF
jgi:putative DNA primase/helicase